jgi:hypothetical protein
VSGGFVATRLRNATVPKGHPTIARRFNAGLGAERDDSPEGTTECQG